MEAVLEDFYILINSGKISSMTDLLPLLEKVIGASGSLFIVAEDVDGEALSTLVVNKIRGTFTSVAAKAPAHGDRRKAMLEDIAILTGGNVVAPEVGLKLDQVGLDARSRSSDCRDQGQHHDRRRRCRRQQRSQGPVSQLASRDRPYRLRLGSREAAGTGGQARRWSLCDQGRRRHRGGAQGEEAPHRGCRLGQRAAIEEGIVAGGGSALIHAAAALDGDLGLTGDERIGVNIVRRACRATSLDR